jgi:PEP-CTERM motif
VKRLLIAIVVLMSVCAYADTTTIFQEDWSSYADGQYNAGSYVGSWYISAGSIDILGPTWYNQPCLASGGGSKCVDLSGSGPGTLVSMDFTFDPGNIYELTFQLAGSHKNNTNQVLVTLGDLFTHTYTMYNNDPFSTYTTGEFTVNAPTTASLTFQNLTTVYSGPLLGTVKLTDPPAPSVPEPMSLALIGSGLAATSITRRFRRKK